jgi:hypothetical protein
VGLWRCVVYYLVEYINSNELAAVLGPFDLKELDRQVLVRTLEYPHRDRFPSLEDHVKEWKGEKR